MPTLNNIATAGLKLTGTGEPYNVYKYLTAAAKAGTQVVIRTTPSPGGSQKLGTELPGASRERFCTPDDQWLVPGSLDSCHFRDTAVLFSQTIKIACYTLL